MPIYDKLPGSISAEAYKSIRTSIKYSSIDNPIKTIVVTSSVPEEGKSTVAANLAVSLSGNGSRVLLMDCDLRRPSIHKKFNLSNLKGLTDSLIEKYEVKEVVHAITDKLYIMTAGSKTPNPAEIIGSRRLEEFIKELKINYDYIVIDTPPLLAVTDAQLLAGKSDGTILVVRYGKTKEKQILNAYKELTKVKATVVGSILNRCDASSTDAYYSYYVESRKSRKERHKKEKNNGQIVKG